MTRGAQAPADGAPADRAPADRAPDVTLSAGEQADPGGAARDMGAGRPTGGFTRALLAAAEQRPEIVGVTADLARYTGMAPFAERYPERFVNVGMAEQDLVAVAGGLAMSGLVPVATTFAAFLTRRAQDFVVMQVALPGRPVVLVGGVAGISPTFGPSHTSIDDLAAMRAVPGLVVLDPCDPVEEEQATAAALAHGGPVYLRTLRATEPRILDPGTHRFEIGRAAVLRQGADIALLASSLMVREALAAAELLAAEGVAAAVADVATLKPFDVETVLDLATTTGAVVTAENHSIRGGLFSATAEVLAQAGVGVPVVPIGVRDVFPPFGGTSYLKEQLGMTADAVAEAARLALRRRERGPRA